MRLQATNSDAESQKELSDFSEWVLSIGEGNVPSQLPIDTLDEMLVPIPQDFLINGYTEPIPAIVDSVYADLPNQYKNVDYLKTRANYAPKMTQLKKLTHIYSR